MMNARKECIRVALVGLRLQSPLIRNNVAGNPILPATLFYVMFALQCCFSVFLTTILYWFSPPAESKDQFMNSEF